MKEKIMNKIKGNSLNKELLKTAIKELQFEKLQVYALRNALEEIETFTDDTLAISVIQNTLERHEIDKLIHTKLIFN